MPVVVYMSVAAESWKMTFQHHAYLVRHHCLASSSSLAHPHPHLHRDLDTHPYHYQYRSSSPYSEPNPLDDTLELAQALLDESFSVVDSVLGSDSEHVESPHYHQTRYYYPISNSHCHSRPQWSSSGIYLRWYLISGAVSYFVMRKDYDRREMLLQIPDAIVTVEIAIVLAGEDVEKLKVEIEIGVEKTMMKGFDSDVDIVQVRLPTFLTL